MRFAVFLAAVSLLAPAGPPPLGAGATQAVANAPFVAATARPAATAGFHPGRRLPADPDAAFAFFLPPASDRPPSRDRLWRALDAAGRQAGGDRVGVHVREIGDTTPVAVAAASPDPTVYARFADEPFILASNAKLFITAAALDVLGPGHLVETRLLVRGEVTADGTLDGDLAVVGGGDPSFSWRLSADGDRDTVFRAWAADLADAGVARVAGDLYLDHARFDPPFIHPQWKPENDLEWYQAPVAALAFNESTVKLRAAPAARPGLPATLSVEPDLPLVAVGGRVRTAASWRDVRLLVRRAAGGGLTVDGGVYHRGAEVELPVAVADPVAWFGAALAAALAGEGIEIAGRVRAVAPRPGLVWRPLAVHRTPLVDLLEVTNHESQNLFAETLVKLVGAARCGAGNWPRGVQAVEEVARSRGVDGPGFQLADGSGLSRGNHATPRQVTALLAGMARHPHRDVYLATLPTGGETATSLEKRLDKAPYAGSFHAKTGTLSGVSTLSGYARGRSGRLYAFSLLAAGDVGRGRRAQDALVRALVVDG